MMLFGLYSVLMPGTAGLAVMWGCGRTWQRRGGWGLSWGCRGGDLVTVSPWMRHSSSLASGG